MDLTRYWRAQHNGSKIEVQWTGTRFHGGWTLRLLVDGKPQAETRSFKRDIVLNGAAGGDPIQAHFKEAGLFRNRCAISAGGAVLADYTQPWNALILTIFFAIWGLVLLAIVSRLLWNRM